jgi:prepilin-type N-terminal cleavage/methylation domain-containing protein
MFIRDKNQSGFSLIELIIVVALIGIVAAISVPQVLRQMPRWHMKGTVRDIASTLMVARLKAIQANQDYSVLFSSSSYRVEIDNDNDPDVEDWNSANMSRGSFDTDVSVVVSGTGCGGEYRIIFYPNGMRGGCDMVTISTTVGPSRSGTVSVGWVSGNIKVEL